MPQKHYLQYNFLKIWGGVGVGVVFPFFFVVSIILGILMYYMLMYLKDLMEFS